LIPVETGAPSVYPFDGEWHDAQETVLSVLSRLSKYNSRPSSTFAAEYKLSSGKKTGGNPKGTFGSASAATALGCPQSDTTSVAANTVTRQNNGTPTANMARKELFITTLSSDPRPWQRQRATRSFERLGNDYLKPVSRAKPANLLFLDRTLNIDGLLSFHFRVGPVDLDDMGHVLDRLLAERGQTIAP